MHGRAGQNWRLSLVIPAYNEAAGIAAAIAEAGAVLAEIAGDYEVIVVDDGSKDDTFAIATLEAVSRPRVRIVKHEQNRGYGAALRTGFEAARFEHVAFTDADCQFDLHDLARLIPHAAEAPIVAGYRIDRKDPWRRRFLSKGYNLLARTLLGTRVRDCDCALKVFRREALHHLLPESRNFFVNTEMLTRARQRNFNVIEVGVTHRPRLRGASKVAMSDVPKTLATLLPFWWTRVLFPGSARTPTRSVSEEASASLAHASGSCSRITCSYLVLVMALAALMFFCRLRTPLLEPEEARYAEIPRQMLAESRWLTPVLHGQPYLDKPPLLYWLVMGSYSIFGVHDWAARIVPGLCGWLTVLVTFWWARRAAGARVAFFAAIILCLCAQFVYYGRMLTMNAPLALFVTATLATAHTAALATVRRNALALWALSGVCIGLGFLTKGPVALALTVPVLLVALRLDPRLRRPGLAGWALFSAAALGTAAPWFALVSIRHPEFAGYFFWFHNVLRFAQPFDHAGPPWQYLPGLLFSNLPWTLLLIPLIALLLRKSIRTAQRRPAALGVFLLSAVWIVAFFSIAGSKRPVYIVPALPPLALALGCALDALLPQVRWASVWNVLRRHRSALAWWTTAGVLIAGLAIAGAAVYAGLLTSDRALLPMLALIGTLVCLISRQRDHRASWLWVGGATAALAAFSVHELLPEYAGRFSMRHPIRMHAWRVPPRESAIYCYPHRFDSVSFYARQNEVVGYSRGQRPELIDALEQRRRALVVVQTKYLDEVLDDLPPSVECVKHQQERNITIVEVRRRREPPMWMAGSR